MSNSNNSRNENKSRNVEKKKPIIESWMLIELDSLARTIQPRIQQLLDMGIEPWAIMLIFQKEIYNLNRTGEEYAK